MEKDMGVLIYSLAGEEEEFPAFGVGVRIGVWDGYQL